MSITPTQAPTLPSDVLAVGRPPTLVTGASGTLGRHVVAELLASSVPVRALTHSSDDVPGDAPTVRGDVATGAGLDEALTGIGAVIHCATSPTDPTRVDVDGTRNLLRALDAWAPNAHLVHVSIIGCWENPLAYYRAKADTENLVEAWHGRSSMVRATQFHPLAHALVSGPRARITGATRDVRVSPVDPAWVATKLVDVALMRTSLAEPIELAGPETFTLADLAALTAHLEGRTTPRAAAIPLLGGALGAFARGSNLPHDDAARGGRAYAQWVRDCARS